MDELSVVVDLTGQVRVALVRRLEHDLGAIGELVVGQVYLSERSFSYQTAQSVVSDRPEIFARELAVKRSLSAYFTWERRSALLGVVERIAAHQREED